MSTTLTISALDVSFAARTLFRGLDLVLADNHVTAVVGPNGSGKSSLMRTIVGELPVESGSIRLAPRDATIGWLPQVVPNASESLLEYARRRTGVGAADDTLHAASAALAEGEPGADERYAEALDRWLALGAGDLEDRLTQVAAQVGLDADPHRPLGSLSGGQAARAALVAVLLSRYDVLLLDEPTNDLDARGLALVVEFVTAHRGPVLIASHDRAFLDRVATHVVELDLPQQRIAHYAGGWSEYVAARDLARRQAHESFERYAAERDHLLAQARRREIWAEKGHRAVAIGGEPDKHQREKFRARADRQSAKAARVKRAVDRLPEVQQPRKKWQLRYSISAGSEPAAVVATLDRAEVARDGFRLGPVDLTVERGDRIAVSGDNGSGKTTLVKALLGELPLTAGRHSLGARVRVGVLDQQRALLDTDASVVDVVRRELGDPDRGEVRTLLAKFGLGAEHVDRPARTLSLGERTRALMALFQGQEVNLLVLDEPTNHLDVAAIEQLESALADYAGTLLVVSHDEALLKALDLTHRWEVEDGRVTVTAL